LPANEPSRDGRIQEAKPSVTAKPHLPQPEQLPLIDADKSRPTLGTEPPQPRSSRWAKRAQLLIFVVLCIELGMLMIVLPWTQFWSSNSLLWGYPELRDVVQHYFIRGAVTGLGIINLWMGIWEAVSYKERKL